MNKYIKELYCVFLPCRGASNELFSEWIRNCCHNFPFYENWLIKKAKDEQIYQSDVLF